MSKFIQCPNCDKKGVTLRKGGEMQPARYICRYCESMWFGPLEDTWLP